MTRKSHKGGGTLLSEVVERLKTKEPELEAALSRGTKVPKRKPEKDQTEFSDATRVGTCPARGEELVKSIEAVVDRKLQKLLDDLVALSPGPGRKVKGESRTVKFTISMPGSLHEQLQELGGTISGHITAAVRLYLRAKQKRKSDS